MKDYKEDRTFDQEEFMTVEEVADYLKCSKATVYKYVREEKIPALRVSGRWRFRKSQIVQWLADAQTACVVKSESRPARRKGAVVENPHNRHVEKGMKLLEDAGILEGLTLIDTQEIASLIRCEERVLEADTMAVCKEEDVDYFIIVERGKLSIEMKSGEHEIISKSDYRRGNIILLDAVMTSMRKSYYDLYVHERSQVMYFYPDSILAGMALRRAAKDTLLMNMMRLLADENIRRMKKIDMLQMRNAREKILLYLMQLESKNGNTPFRMFNNQTEMAKHLNISRSALSSELNDIKNEGIIDYSGNIIVINHELLKKAMKSGGG
ncbi:MAG: helix-turn-helix domain-containing protein [Anaerovoracaceae bacterium]